MTRAIAQIKTIFLLMGLCGAAPAWAQQSPTEWIKFAVEQLCPLDDLDGLSAQSALPGSWMLEETRQPPTGEARRITVRLLLPGADELELERRQAGRRLRQFIATHYAAEGDRTRPTLQGSADAGCILRAGRRITRDGPVNQMLDQLDADLTTVRWSETLQTAWPPGEDPGGPRVALIDSGLAYDLPLFRDRLARGTDGTPLGYDFWDLDPWPYDGDVSRGAFLPIRHGTAVASILTREAPEAALIPYRYPRGHLERMAELINRAEAAGARIIAMPLGSNRREDWQVFAGAMRGRDMLAIVSAGNNGRDIDAAPVWPAALPLENMIVVTSSDAFGRLADGSNWGATNVDVMLPGENLPVTDFRGAQGRASGTSYAVPRLAALAARILARAPALTAAELKARILERATPSPFERREVVAVGWIPDPQTD